MASRKSNVKKISIKKLPKFELDVYSQFSLSDLVVFALSYLEEKEVEASTEEIISICFRLFPHSFGLKNYPRWPDSALVIRRLNDAREKKLVKGNPNEGFALTFKGKQVVKRISKALGIVDKKKKAKPASKPKPAALILTKKTLRKRVRKHVRKIKASRRKKPIRKPIKPTARKAVVKKKTVALLKVQPKQVKVVKKKSSLKKVKPKQLTLALPPVSVKKKVEVKKKQVEARTEPRRSVKKEALVSKSKHAQASVPVAVRVSISKEEKVTAGKVIKIVERSDAYRLYTKNGKHAKISEFDFRNMLFATMESSSDTLTRNVGLFKRYANIYNRNDLIKFFDFCEEHFAKLLKKR